MSSNCKVHFAIGRDEERDISALKLCGANYMLFTAYPYIKNKRESYKFENLVAKRANFKHVIVDSGLFTLMFGADKNKVLTADDLRDWMHRIVDFAKQNKIPNASYVECDCQKLAGVELAWELRKEMRELLPGYDIMNVYHLEDGVEGFDRLVEFSDYIAISVPELRIHRGNSYKEMTHTLAKRARLMKPSIKIHLLGCTEKPMLIQNKDIATTADSSSWSSANRFGYIGDIHCDRIKLEVREKLWNEYCQQRAALDLRPANPTPKMLRYIATQLIATRLCLDDYRKWCGSQD